MDWDPAISTNYNKYSSNQRPRRQHPNNNKSIFLNTRTAIQTINNFCDFNINRTRNIITKFPPAVPNIYPSSYPLYLRTDILQKLTTIIQDFEVGNPDYWQTNGQRSFRYNNRFGNRDNHNFQTFKQNNELRNPVLKDNQDVVGLKIDDDVTQENVLHEKFKETLQHFGGNDASEEQNQVPEPKSTIENVLEKAEEQIKDSFESNSKSNKDQNQRIESSTVCEIANEVRKILTDSKYLYSENNSNLIVNTIEPEESPQSKEANSLEIESSFLSDSIQSYKQVRTEPDSLIKNYPIKRFRSNSTPSITLYDTRLHAQAISARKQICSDWLECFEEPKVRLESYLKHKVHRTLRSVSCVPDVALTKVPYRYIVQEVNRLKSDTEIEKKLSFNEEVKLMDCKTYGQRYGLIYSNIENAVTNIRNFKIPKKSHQKKASVEPFVPVSLNLSSKLTIPKDSSSASQKQSEMETRRRKLINQEGKAKVKTGKQKFPNEESKKKHLSQSTEKRPIQDNSDEETLFNTQKKYKRIKTIGSENHPRTNCIEKTEDKDAERNKHKQKHVVKENSLKQQEKVKSSQSSSDKYSKDFKNKEKTKKDSKELRDTAVKHTPVEDLKTHHKKLKHNLLDKPARDMSAKKYKESNFGSGESEKQLNAGNTHKGKSHAKLSLNRRESCESKCSSSFSLPIAIKKYKIKDCHVALVNCIPLEKRLLSNMEKVSKDAQSTSAESIDKSVKSSIDLLKEQKKKVSKDAQSTSAESIDKSMKSSFALSKEQKKNIHVHDTFSKLPTIDKLRYPDNSMITEEILSAENTKITNTLTHSDNSSDGYGKPLSDLSKQKRKKRKIHPSPDSPVSKNISAKSVSKRMLTGDSPAELTATSPPLSDASSFVNSLPTTPSTKISIDFTFMEEPIPPPPPVCVSPNNVNILAAPKSVARVSTDDEVVEAVTRPPLSGSPLISIRSTDVSTIEAVTPPPINISPIMMNTSPISTQTPRIATDATSIVEAVTAPSVSVSPLMMNTSAISTPTPRTLTDTTGVAAGISLLQPRSVSPIDDLGKRKLPQQSYVSPTTMSITQIPSPSAITSSDADISTSPVDSTQTCVSSAPPITMNTAASTPSANISTDIVTVVTLPQVIYEPSTMNFPPISTLPQILKPPTTMNTPTSTASANTSIDIVTAVTLPQLIYQPATTPISTLPQLIIPPATMDIIALTTSQHFVPPATTTPTSTLPQRIEQPVIMATLIATPSTGISGGIATVVGTALPSDIVTPPTMEITPTSTEPTRITTDVNTIIDSPRSMHFPATSTPPANIPSDVGVALVGSSDVDTVAEVTSRSPSVSPVMIKISPTSTPLTSISSDACTGVLARMLTDVDNVAEATPASGFVTPITMHISRTSATLLTNDNVVVIADSPSPPKSPARLSSDDQNTLIDSNKSCRKSLIALAWEQMTDENTKAFQTDVKSKNNIENEESAIDGKSTKVNGNSDEDLLSKLDSFDNGVTSDLITLNFENGEDVPTKIILDDTQIRTYLNINSENPEPRSNSSSPLISTNNGYLDIFLEDGSPPTPDFDLFFENTSHNADNENVVPLDLTAHTLSLFEIFERYVENEYVYNKALFVNHLPKMRLMDNYKTTMNFAMNHFQISEQFSRKVDMHSGGQQADVNQFLKQVCHMKSENLCVYLCCLLRMIAECNCHTSFGKHFLKQLLEKASLLHHVNPDAYIAVMDEKFKKHEKNGIDDYLEKLAAYNQHKVDSEVGYDKLSKDDVLRHLICGDAFVGNREPLSAFAAKDVLTYDQILRRSLSDRDIESAMPPKRRRTSSGDKNNTKTDGKATSFVRERITVKHMALLRKKPEISESATTSTFASFDKLDERQHVTNCNKALIPRPVPKKVGTSVTQLPLRSSGTKLPTTVYANPPTNLAALTSIGKRRLSNEQGQHQLKSINTIQSGSRALSEKINYKPNGSAIVSQDLLFKPPLATAKSHRQSKQTHKQVVPTYPNVSTPVATGTSSLPQTTTQIHTPNLRGIRKGVPKMSAIQKQTTQTAPLHSSNYVNISPPSIDVPNAVQADMHSHERYSDAYLQFLQTDSGLPATHALENQQRLLQTHQQTLPLTHNQTSAQMTHEQQICFSKQWDEMNKIQLENKRLQQQQQQRRMMLQQPQSTITSQAQQVLQQQQQQQQLLHQQGIIQQQQPNFQQQYKLSQLQQGPLPQQPQFPIPHQPQYVQYSPISRLMQLNQGLPTTIAYVPDQERPSVVTTRPMPNAHAVPEMPAVQPIAQQSQMKEQVANLSTKTCLPATPTTIAYVPYQQRPSVVTTCPMPNAHALPEMPVVQPIAQQSQMKEPVANLSPKTCLPATPDTNSANLDLQQQLEYYQKQCMELQDKLKISELKNNIQSGESAVSAWHDESVKVPQGNKPGNDFLEQLLDSLKYPEVRNVIRETAKEIEPELESSERSSSILETKPVSESTSSVIQRVPVITWPAGKIKVLNEDDEIVISDDEDCVKIEPIEIDETANINENKAPRISSIASIDSGYSGFRSPIDHELSNNENLQDFYKRQYVCICNAVATIPCKCKAAIYCSEECRLNNLPDHEPTCKLNLGFF